jgi:mRNA interferase MazF
MGLYLPGDVILVPVALDSRSAPKTRPAVIVKALENGRYSVVPVSSRPPSDAVSMPIGVDDFATGGLDLFSESYAMPAHVRIIESREIIGKRGRLLPEPLNEIASSAGRLQSPEPQNMRNSRRSGNRDR